MDEAVEKKTFKMGCLFVEDGERIFVAPQHRVALDPTNYFYWLDKGEGELYLEGELRIADG